MNEAHAARWLEIDTLMAAAQSLDEHRRVRDLLFQAYDEGVFEGMEVPSMDYIMDDCMGFVREFHPEHEKWAMDYAAFFARLHHERPERERWGMGHALTWDEYVNEKGLKT